jgi:hypothetical protein
MVRLKLCHRFRPINAERLFQSDDRRVDFENQGVSCTAANKKNGVLFARRLLGPLVLLQARSARATMPA